MTPSLIEAAEQLTALTAHQVLELAPELKQLAGGEQDSAQGLHHHPGKLEVLLHDQQLRHAPVDVLAAKQHTQLADDEGALALQEVLVRAEQLQQGEHELLEVWGGDLTSEKDELRMAIKLGSNVQT